MDYVDARNLALTGKKVRRKAWNDSKYVFFLSHEELAEGLGYGHGEEGESNFIGKLVLHSTSGNLHIGWKPSNQDKLIDDWEIKKDQ